MKPAESSAMRRIVVAGGGVEAWLTAGVLGKMLGRRTVEIVVCNVQGSEAWDSLYSVLPLHPDDAVRRLGVSDLELVREHDASFSLGTNVSTLPAGSPIRFLPYGPTGLNFAGVSFHHHWLLAGGGSPTSGYFRYSPGARAMAAKRFAPPVPRNAIDGLQHEIARHVNPVRILPRLSAAATALGNVESGAAIVNVARAGGGPHIDHVVTTAGDRIDADLFVDCSGPVRFLRSRAPETRWIHAPLAPRYRIGFRCAPRQTPPSPCHNATASDGGWHFSIPTCAEDISVVLSRDDTATGTESFVSGYVSQPWTANCVAIGHAACALLPVAPLQTLQLTASLKRLVNLLPGPDNTPAETLEYNQLFARELADAQDFLAVHELAHNGGGLAAGAWSDLPEGLARRLALFRKHGWVVQSDSDLVPDHAWSSLLLFYGLTPQRHSLLAEREPTERLSRNLAELASRIDDVVAEFPTHETYLNAVRESEGAA